ncbi:hypothetical protein D3C81_1937960 [compost metagenome]
MEELGEERRAYPGPQEQPGAAAARVHSEHDGSDVRCAGCEEGKSFFERRVT